MIIKNEFIGVRYCFRFRDILVIRIYKIFIVVEFGFIL